MLEGKIKKILVRNKYKEGSDICIALAIQDNELICKTCYLNKQSDNHNTLNPNKYIIENEKTKYTIGTTATIAELIKYKNEQNKKH